MKISKDGGSKVMTVIASPGQGPDRSTEVSYTDTKVGFHLILPPRQTAMIVLILHGDRRILRIFFFIVLDR